MKCPHFSTPRSKYNPFEISVLQGPKDCSKCSKNRRIRCQKARDKIPPSPTGYPKQKDIDSARKCRKPLQIKGQIINNNESFRTIPMDYERTIDRKDHNAKILQNNRQARGIKEISDYLQDKEEKGLLDPSELDEFKLILGREPKKGSIKR
ncbi:MAG: hypothetical protein OIN66_16245 [Candidatus Methanoperedens sp.]|nr:hypothetical protein [Candidatus Methanoperedens sp.]